MSDVLDSRAFERMVGIVAERGPDPLLNICPYCSAGPVWWSETEYKQHARACAAIHRGLEEQRALARVKAKKATT